MKYMGSKARLAKHIVPIVSANLNGRTYVEPFAGGMNMICEVRAPVRIANDFNTDLIELFKALNAGWRPKSHYTKTEYDWFKLGNGSPHERAYVAVCCSYSGKWFGGFAGRCETKEGFRDYQAEALSNVISQISKLQNVIYTSGDYRNAPIPAGSVVYCDPPYVNTTGYNAGDSEFNHGDFWQWVRDLSKKCEVYVSEYTAPDDFRMIWEKPVRSSLSVNATGQAAKTSVERLFVYA